MKAHIGVEADSGTVNADRRQHSKRVCQSEEGRLPACEEKGILSGNARGSKEKAEALAAKWAILLPLINAKVGRRLHDLVRQTNRLITSPRSKVEHMFEILKCLRYRKTRYLGLFKNMARFKVLFGLGNFYVQRKI